MKIIQIYIQFIKLKFKIFKIYIKMYITRYNFRPNGDDQYRLNRIDGGAKIFDIRKMQI